MSRVEASTPMARWHHVLRTVLHPSGDSNPPGSARLLLDRQVPAAVSGQLGMHASQLGMHASQNHNLIDITV